MDIVGNTVLQSFEKPGLKLKIDSFSYDNLFLSVGRNIDFLKKSMSNDFLSC